MDRKGLDHRHRNNQVSGINTRRIPRGDAIFTPYDKLACNGNNSVGILAHITNRTNSNENGIGRGTERIRKFTWPRVPYAGLANAVASLNNFMVGMGSNKDAGQRNNESAEPRWRTDCAGYIVDNNVRNDSKDDLCASLHPL